MLPGSSSPGQKKRNFSLYFSGYSPGFLVYQNRDVAQFGRALGWGSRGRYARSVLVPTAAFNWERLAWKLTRIFYTASLRKNFIRDLVMMLQKDSSAITAYTCIIDKTWCAMTLIWHQECASRCDARKLELKIKKRGAKRFLQDLSNQA